jgi:hypothetical protein
MKMASDFIKYSIMRNIWRCSRAFVPLVSEILILEDFEEIPFEIFHAIIVN